MRASVSLLAATLLWVAIAWSDALVAHADLPKAAGAINDFADVLTADEERALDQLVDDLEQATTAEIAVATVTSLDGLTVEEYATQLFAAWGVGQAGKDNGVLILVAPGERAMRIEVGYGLEGILPDGLAGQIIRETFLPAFREGAFGRGIVAGTTRVAEIVRRNEPVTAEQLQALAAAESANGNAPGLPYVLVGFLSIFVAIGFGLAGMGAGERTVGPIILGAIFGGIPVGIVALSDVTAGRWIVVVVAVLAFVAAMRWARRRTHRSRGSRRGGRGASRGWTWGTGGSSARSGSSGSSSSSSSGSFGGGRSGGGGATGRW